MSRPGNLPETQLGRFISQARYLTSLLSSSEVSAREFARRSKLIAGELGKPELAVSHQAVSSWLNGTRHISGKHKEVAAMILGVSIAELSSGCDPEPDIVVDPTFTAKPTVVVVPSSIRSYQYSLALKADIDLSRPAIYQDWSSMFSFPPTHLQRHLRNINSDSFGWIPDQSASPMVHYPGCLVPVAGISERNSLQMLDPAESSQRHVWFVYLPDGQLHVGIGYRNNHSFVFTKNVGNRLVLIEFPLRRVDLVGCFIGKVVFHLLPPRNAGSMQVQATKGELKTSVGILETSKNEYMSKNARV